MSYKGHRRRPTSIATDEIFRSQIANTYVAADGQVLQSSLIKNGSPSKKQLAGSTSQVRFSLPVSAETTSSEDDNDEDRWTNITDDEDEDTDAMNLANDEPKQRTDNHFSHRRAESAEGISDVISDERRGRRTNRPDSFADSMRQLISDSPDRTKLFLKPNSDMNDRPLAVPIELSLPPFLSPRNKNKSRPKSLVFNGHSYEAFGTSIGDKPAYTFNPPKKLFSTNSIVTKNALSSEDAVDNGKISIPDLSKRTFMQFRIAPPCESIENESAIENPSPAAKRQNNNLNKEFSFPNVQPPSSDTQKDLPEVPKSFSKTLSNSPSGLNLFTEEGTLASPTRASFRFSHQPQSPIKFHERKKSQIISLDDLPGPSERSEAPTHEFGNQSRTPNKNKIITSEVAVPNSSKTHRVSSSEYSNITNELSLQAETDSLQAHRVSSSKYSDLTNQESITYPQQRNVSAQSFDSIQNSIQDSVQDSIQNSLQGSIPETFQDSIPDTLLESIEEINNSESVEDLTQQLADLGLSILHSTNESIVPIDDIGQFNEQIQTVTALSIPIVKENRRPKIQENEPAQETSIAYEDLTEIETSTTQKSSQNGLSYHYQYPHRVYPQDNIEADKIRSTSMLYSSKRSKRELSPLISQSSQESEYSEPFSQVSRGTIATSVAESGPTVIDLTDEFYEHAPIANKVGNIQEYRTVMKTMGNGDLREVIIIDEEYYNNKADKYLKVNKTRNFNNTERPKSCLGNIEFTGTERAFSNFSFQTVASEVQLRYNPSKASLSSNDRSIPISHYPTSNRNKKDSSKSVIELCEDTMRNTQAVMEDLKRQRTILFQKHHEALRQRKKEMKC
jgi:hypothetical protein